MHRRAGQVNAMPSIVADRFVANGAGWIDLATGTSVRLRTVAAFGRRAQLASCTHCDALARLRHPLLRPLVDYGPLDGSTMFEAYAELPPIAASPSAAARLRDDALQFLHTHGASVEPEAASYLLRDCAGASSPRTRPIGIVLQQRNTERPIAEFLDAAGPGGPGLLTIIGEPGSGLRTVRVLLARAARIRGYLPIAAHTLTIFPWLHDDLLERHVCVLLDDALQPAVRRAAARLVAHLGRVSTRRHLVIDFTRAPVTGRGLRLEGMGVTAMAGMVFVDEQGPTPSEIFAAARRADGKPGAFLEHLHAYVFDTHVSSASIAHEAAQPYVVALDGSQKPLPPAPKPSALLARALDRARALAGRGRHAAAIRVLTRATRVLEGRGDTAAAAGCAEQLGSLWLHRGNITAAIDGFERAQTLARDTDTTSRAALGLAQAWTENGRLIEAEALLRSIAVSASVEHRPLAAAVACALARCLYWQNRFDEASVILHPFVTSDSPDVPCLAMAARIRLAAGAVPEGVMMARRAVQLLPARQDRETAATAHRALGIALAAAGDCFAARNELDRALRAAHEAHRPLMAIRARLALLVAAERDEETRTIARRLSSLAHGRSLPPLLKTQIDKALSAIAARSRGVAEPTGMSDVERLLEACHTSADDQQAVDRICAAVVHMACAASVVVVAADNQRLLGRDGRPWTGESAAVARVRLTGRPVAPDVEAGPLEAAAPVRYGGEIVAVIAARWIVGADVSIERATSIVKAAALAAAAPVRGLLDRTVVAPADPAWQDLLGESAAAVALRDATARAARAPFPVLIEGESGSGKELVARAIHRLGARRDRRFCAVNCAALTDDLIEAELFGHARGSFTGALGERAGLFEEADGGTLFLDEVGELSARGQAKLLRVLQEGEIRRIGENVARRVDVRIVAATNRRLHHEVEAGRFRQDLRFRLDVVRIHVPPLRERVTDILLLAVHFWNDAARRVGSRATLSPETLSALARYDWPGNVRELQNVIAWMAVHSPRRGRIGSGALPRSVASALAIAPVTFEAAREEFERRFVRSALAQANGHRSQAAASLGVTRQGLAKIMRRLRIDALVK